MESVVTMMRHCFHCDKDFWELTPPELFKRGTKMTRIRPILQDIWGHDHCPICLRCCLPSDDELEHLGCYAYCLFTCPTSDWTHPQSR